MSSLEPIPVASLDDPRLAEFRLNERGLASRAAKRNDAGEGFFLAEGDLVIERALDAGCNPYRALIDEAQRPAVAERFARAGGEIFVGGNDVRRAVTGLGVSYPIVGLFHRPPRPSAAQLLERSRRLVVVEGVDNPANVGSIVRNAAALGWDGLLLDHTSADPLARRSLRVAMGTVFALPHARTTRLLDDIARAAPAMDLFALTPRADAIPIDDLRHSSADRPRAIIIGSERAGLSDEILMVATPVRIPMSASVDSLNAAAATAVACYALA